MANNDATNTDLAYADTLWRSADALRGQVDAAEYKHVVLGLLFLKYISDSFAARREELKAELQAEGITGRQLESLLENRDEYTAERVFWVPPEARWANLQNQATRPDIATLIDDAILAVERDNPNLKGKLPRDYARRGIEPVKLKGLIDLIADVGFKGGRSKARDTLGRVYEYFLGKFAQAEGKLGGEFYTPRCVVRVLVEMLEPYNGRVYDPCCGSGGMFVQSERFVEAHGGNTTDISIFGQESNPTTWRLAHMNLAIRSIEANLGSQPADAFLRNLHPDLKADYILANPPFNVSDWSGKLLQEDVRWRHGTPPLGNANYAWIQHFIHHLAPPNGHGGGVAGFVMANGSLSSNTGGEGEIRRRIVRTARALERLARAIFRAWFVDFEPVNAKAAGATSFPSMPQPVFDALPTRLVDSEIGPVPEGWEVKPLSQTVLLTMGQSPPSEFYNKEGNGLPFHQGVTDYGFRFPTHRVYCTAEGRLAEPGDVLLSVRAPVGRINVADRRLVLGRGLAGLRHRNGCQSFLLQQLRHLFVEEDAVGDGTIYKAVTKEFFAKMSLLAPAEIAQQAFEDMARPLDDLVAASEIENRKLAELRDYLLPKLLSGEVRVKDTERLLEATI
jgi:type I restriction-modification system DNA methylase subunit